MEAFLSLLNEEILYQFLLLLARVLSFVAFMPVFGHVAISPTIRIAFAFFIAVVKMQKRISCSKITKDYYVGW